MTGRLRVVALAGTLLVCAMISAIVSYRGWIDGPFTQFMTALALGAMMATALLGWAALEALPVPVGVGLAVAVAAPLPAVHALRLAHRDAMAETRLTAPVAYGAALTPVLGRGAGLEATPSALVLRAPQGTTGYLEVRRTLDWMAGWLWPRALVTGDDPRTVEELTFRGMVALDHTYFALVDAEPLSAQVTPYGLLVTAPGRDGKPNGQGVQLPGANGQWHEWSLRRLGRTVEIDVDGKVIWSASDVGPWRTLRLGETHTDAEHGGALQVSALTYRRRLA
jgi:hypothetical protein